VLIKSPQSQTAEKKEKEKPKEDEKGEKKDKSKDKEKERDKSIEKKPEKCDKCGKKVTPCSESCKGRSCSEDHKSRSKSESDCDRSKDGEEKSGVESSKEASGWTKQQDSKIKEMKGENKSWKDIALEVGASKKDVQNRYKELMKGGEGEKEKEKEESKSENGWGVGRDADSGANMPDFGALFVDDDEGGGERSEGENRSDKNNSGNVGGGKRQKNKQNKQSSNSGNGGGEQNPQKGSPSGFGNPFDDPPEQAPTGKLRPDGAWTQDDCEILEYLKSKYEENKWLHMQAGFYNWTGRMVIAQLIEQKFKDDGAA
jgi:hypothetical protein